MSKGPVRAGFARQLRLRPLLLLASLATLLGCVSVNDDTAVLPDSIGPNQGMLVLVIDSSTFFQRLKFKRPGDVFSTVATMNVPAGRTVRFISIKPGTYYWDRFEYPTVFNYASYVDFTGGRSELTFTVKPGTVSYAGDLYIRYEDGGYDVRMLDHSAMLLGDLNEQQQELISKYGIAYTGKGSDRFYSYYFSLPHPAPNGHN